jgi:hypothetical protein
VKPAVHAVSALAWALEPPAVMVPESELRSTLEADGVGVFDEPLELPAQDERAIAVAMASTPTAATFLSFTVFPFGLGYGTSAPAQTGSVAHCDLGRC